MFFALSQAQLSQDAALRCSMLMDRRRQFIERHRWALTLDDAGLEVDEYDDALATYCIVSNKGRHLASARLRPANAGCMAERHFPALWQEVLRPSVEITRFCASPGLSPEERLTTVSDFLLGLCRQCQRSGIERFFGVVFPSVIRVLQQSGWAAEVLKKAQGREGMLILAQWKPSDLVAWNIQERRELREEAGARRREMVTKRLLVA